MKDPIVSDYFSKQDPDKKKICLELRKIVFETFPAIKEEMKYGVPYYAGLFYIAPVKHGVNLGFMIKGLSKKEIELFEGKGEHTRHKKYEKMEDVKKQEIVRLLRILKKD